VQRPRPASRHLGRLSRYLVATKVLDASGQALVYIYARETREQASIDKALLRQGAAPARRFAQHSLYGGAGVEGS
jgi:hypothetical protein